MRVIGLGNALTDVLAILNSDECIQEMGLLKGGMQLIDEDKLLKIMAMFEDFDKMGLYSVIFESFTIEFSITVMADFSYKTGFYSHTGKPG